MTTFADKFIPGRYIDLPANLFPKSASSYGSQDVGEFIAIPNKMLILAQSTKSKQYGGRLSATAQGAAAKMHRNYRWLTYLPYRNTYTAITGVDILTGFMSGCHVIAYSENGRPHLVHVGTADDATKNQLTKDAWNNYAASLNVTIHAGFNPLTRWKDNWPDHEGSERPYCIALVTPSYDLYTIALMRQGTNTVYRIAGIDKVNSMSLAQLQNL